MFASLARRLLGSARERQIKTYRRLVDAINALEKRLEALSDDALRLRTVDFRKQLAAGKTADDLLVPSFATVREAAKRTIGTRHFDVDLIGGMVLHEGRITEMKNGEGSALTATSPVYLNALAGKGVHVVAVNDYAAKRDAEWMGQIYGFLGLTTGVVVNGLDDMERKKQYRCDVTYGTSSEFGFDYLRDNMKYRLEDMVQRGHVYAIVDEVDSILIDESRTPLIITRPLDGRASFFNAIDGCVRNLDNADCEMNEAPRTASITEAGMTKLEPHLKAAGVLKSGSLQDAENVALLRHVNQALRAHKLFQRDKDYIVRNGEVVIVDEFTGRVAPSRRFSDGLHPALEAKEWQPIQPENETLASITFQNYFRIYSKLAGMTGTALTEADAFREIYGLEVVEVPINMPLARLDEQDEVYRTAAEKYRAIIALLEECKAKGQPVLVGATSIEKSEQLAEMLRQKGWEELDFSDPGALAALYSEGQDATKKTKAFAVLNARNHEQEAYIMSQAGVPGAVTIVTNMAGRDTDIQLGGSADMRIRQELANVADYAARMHDPRADAIRAQTARLKEKALRAGGLFVIGTEHHESRRVDNKLRGRAGRQGDPGRSKFFFSLEDDLARIYKPDGLQVWPALKEDETIIHPWITKAVENAQRKIEARNLDIRKNMLKFDNIMNDQRKVVLAQRVDWMDERDAASTVAGMLRAVIDDLVARHVPAHAPPQLWDTSGLRQEIKRILGLDIPVEDWAKENDTTDEELARGIEQRAREHRAAKVAQWGSDVIRYVEKSILLQTLDHVWREHVLVLEHLNGLGGHSQSDLVSVEAFNLFEAMFTRLREAVIAQLMRVEIVQQSPAGEQPQ